MIGAGAAVADERQEQAKQVEEHGRRCKVMRNSLNDASRNRRGCRQAARGLEHVGIGEAGLRAG